MVILFQWLRLSSVDSSRGKLNDWVSSTPERNLKRDKTYFTLYGHLRKFSSMSVTTKDVRVISLEHKKRRKISYVHYSQNGFRRQRQRNRSWFLGRGTQFERLRTPHLYSVWRSRWITSSFHKRSLRGSRIFRVRFSVSQRTLILNLTTTRMVVPSVHFVVVEKGLVKMSLRPYPLFMKWFGFSPVIFCIRLNLLTIRISNSLRSGEIWDLIFGSQRGVS